MGFLVFCMCELQRFKQNLLFCLRYFQILILTVIFKILFIYFLAGLGLVFAACGLSLVTASEAASCTVCGLLVVVASLVGVHGLQSTASIVTVPRLHCPLFPGGIH